MRLYLTLTAMCLCIAVIAQTDDAARKRNFNLDNGVAMREFDPVSYFKGKPVKGSSKFTEDYRGVTYYFSSEENKTEFTKAPAKYEPVYGGWCAYTVATTGERVKISPQAYKIIDGKLYLFYNFNGDNRLLKWNTNEKSLKAAAESKWKAKMH
jgi:YHS domain-containing protein